MATISAKEFLGGQPATLVGSEAHPDFQQSYLSRVTGNISNDFSERKQRVDEIIQRPNTNILEKGAQIFGQGAGLAAGALETTVGELPGVKQAVNAAGAGIEALSKTPPIQAIGKAIGGNPKVQEVVHLYDTDQNFKDTVDGVANIFRLGGDLSVALKGVEGATNVVRKAPEVISDLKTSIKPPKGPGGGTKTPGLVTNMTRDIVPTMDRFVNHQVTQALDLTQGDVKNIHLSTGNDVGDFLARNNLIGGNVEETVKLVNSFYKKNYNAVRSEIGKVKDLYVEDEIPQYTEALKEIKRQISGTAGLQEANAELDSLLSEESFTLNDVQRVKELMDEHFSLYKATGDVKDSIAKEGLAKIRNSLQTFIEKQVKEHSGADINAFNKNVSTARSIEDAVETRSTRGLTRSNLSLGDMGTYAAGSGAFGGNPITGLIAVLIKRGIESPSFKLKLSKWLDSLSDAQKARINQELSNGKVPPELEKLVSEEKI